MATIVLAAAGAAAGGAIGGAALGISAAVWGQALGASIGGAIDNALFGPGDRTIEQNRMQGARVQKTAEGAEMPRLAGRMRIAGQLIWTSGFQEDVTSTSTGGGKSGPTITTETYRYSSSIAVALCEGEISKIGRIWADGHEIDRSLLNITVYLGGQHQQPDPVIVGYETLESTPAFRGTAYVVIEDMELGEYGNRIPQMTFEVFRKTDHHKQARQDASRQVRAVSLIPGSGEFILGTTPVTYEGEFANSSSANLHTNRGQTDFIHGIEDLRADLPNCDRISMVLTWFGDDLRCNHCQLRPKVEHHDVDSGGAVWTVGGLTRPRAQLVGRIDARPAFGGTPSDQSVLEGIAALKAQGIGVTLYPFIIMDIMADNTLPNPWNSNENQPTIPWRGRITASIAPTQSASPDQSAVITAQVAAFFGTASADDFTISNGQVHYDGPNEWSYRRFILHHTALAVAAGGVDAFCIGSEMRSLTQLRDDQNNFPAVDQLIALAQQVRMMLGPATKIGYAADWSEYFGYQPADGSGDVFFHLDKLWGDDEIDFVGIDNYMPLSDWRDRFDHADAQYQSLLNADYLAANIEGGEGYDWYYQSDADRAGQIRTPIVDDWLNEDWIYRYKDIRNWWSNLHYERIGGGRSNTPTPWVAQSKPIWFTEYGFPAVDKGTNQPNVFVDPKSSESYLPYFSIGQSDISPQMAGVHAINAYWGQTALNPISNIYGDPMIDMDHAYLWAWDARPWPDFPDRQDIWSDGANYQLGHWVTGRMTQVALADLVAELCETVGLFDYDSSQLIGYVAGFIYGGANTARNAIEQLSQAYQFIGEECDGILIFRHLTGQSPIQINYDDLVSDSQHSAELTQPAPFEVAGRLGVGFWDVQADYQFAVSEVTQRDQNNQAIEQFNFPLALTAQQAQKTAGQLLTQRNAAAHKAVFSLPPSRHSVALGDIIELHTPDVSGQYRVVECDAMSVCRINAMQLAPDIDWVAGAQAEPLRKTNPQSPPLPVDIRILDLPQLSTGRDMGVLHVLGTATPWPKRVAMLHHNDFGGWRLGQIIDRAGILGRILSPLDRAAPDRWANQVIYLRTSSPHLSSQSALAVYSGANWLAIRPDPTTQWEVIGYADAELQNDGNYKLSKLLRGLRGTDAFIPDQYPIGSEIAILNDALATVDMSWANLGQSVQWRYGPARLPYDHDVYRTQTVTVQRVDQRPFAPAHLSCTRTGGDVYLRWIRRSRIAGTYWDTLDVPLIEAENSYVIELANANTAQTWTSTQPELHLTHTDLINAGLVGDVVVSVAQFSQIYGTGPAIRKTLYV